MFDAGRGDFYHEKEIADRIEKLNQYNSLECVICGIGGYFTTQLVVEEV